MTSPTTMVTEFAVVDGVNVGVEVGWYARLKDIAAPTFVANGDRDELFPRSIPPCSRARSHTASSETTPTAATHSCFSIPSDVPTTSAAFSRPDEQLSLIELIK